MAITYTWSVTGIKTADLQDYTKAVVQTYWKKTGTDENGFTGEFIGATPFSQITIPPEDFIPFDQLTEEAVIGWIQDVVVDDYELHVNGRIEKAINEAKLNATTTQMPWAPDIPVDPMPGATVAAGANNP
jgi:hypothetical protein